MHQCPYCGEECSCDGDEMWHEAPWDCEHALADEDDEEEDL